MRFKCLLTYYKDCYQQSPGVFVDLKLSFMSTVQLRIQSWVIDMGECIFCYHLPNCSSIKLSYPCFNLDNQGKRSKRSSESEVERPRMSYNQLIILVRGIFESDSSDLCQHRMMCQLAVTTLHHTGNYKKIFALFFNIPKAFKLYEKKEGSAPKIYKYVIT